MYFHSILGNYFGYLVIGGITVALLYGRKNLNAEEDQNGQPVQSGIFSYWPSFWRTQKGQNDQKGKTQVLHGSYKWLLCLKNAGTQISMFFTSNE